MNASWRGRLRKTAAAALRPALLGLVLLAAPPATAMEAGELEAAVAGAAATARTLAAGEWNNAGESALVDRIDDMADAFHDGAAAGTPLGRAAAALLELTATTHERYTSVLEAMQAEVIRIDGDLEAVQDSAGWRDRELLAMRLLYRLNWIRYEVAMRYERETARRIEHLEKAREGFAEFIGSGDRVLANESLFGHGLAAKALKDYARALADFQAVLEGEPSPELALRVRVAMAESQLAGKRTGDALTTTLALLEAKPAGEVGNQALFLRAKALLLALAPGAGTTEPAARARLRSEAARRIEELYGAGRYWEAKAIQLIDAGIQDPAEWALERSSPFASWLVAESLRRRGECAAAIGLYRDLLARGVHATESRYGLGFCSFYEGDYATARSELGRLLERSSAGHAYRSQAAFLRFKAAESLFLRTSGADRGEAEQVYLEALRTFLDIAPRHEQAYEAWFRLGEWHRDRGEHGPCAEAFEKVVGSSAFRLKARFLAAQCRTQAILDLPEDTEVDPAGAALALSACDGFLEEAAALRASRKGDDAALMAPMEAKAVVMGAALAPRTTAGTMADRLARLEGFEERFPSEASLLPEVRSLRIVAYRTVGDLDGAGDELERLLAATGGSAYRRDALKKLGLLFLKEAARRDEAGDPEGARRARGVALTVYEKLLSEARGGPPDQAVQGLERLVADLRNAAVTPAVAP